MKRLPVAGLILAAACGSEEPAPPVVRDSLGITIVENIEPAWGGSSQWQLSGAPIVEIGGAAGGDPNYQFSGVIGSVRLDDGTIVVANDGTKELRWYDASGSWRHTAGGAAAGPAEFVRIEWLGRFGPASVIAYDRGNLRFSIFDGDGTLLQSTGLVVTFQTPPGSVQGVFGDSTLLVVRGVRYWADALMRSGDSPEGLVRGPSTVSRYTSTGEYINGLGTFAGSEQIFQTGRTRIVRLRARPFGRDAVFAAAGDRLYVGTQDDFEIRVRHYTDSLTTIIRAERGKVPVSQADVDRYVSARMAGVHEVQRADREAELRALPYPDTMPAFADILVDTEGNLWVADFRPFGTELPFWTVFDATHRMLGTVATPSGLTVLQVGSDFVLGVARDDSGTETVQVYALNKQAG